MAYILMFGRNPMLPKDVTLGLHVEEQQPSSKCISDLCIPSVYINVDVCPVHCLTCVLSFCTFEQIKYVKTKYMVFMHHIIGLYSGYSGRIIRIT
jgi:hypothetical protein